MLDNYLISLNLSFLIYKMHQDNTYYRDTVRIQWNNVGLKAAQTKKYNRDVRAYNCVYTLHDQVGYFIQNALNNTVRVDFEI